MNWKEVRGADWTNGTDGLEAVSQEEVRRGLEAIGLGDEEPREIRILKKSGVLSGVFNDAKRAAEVVCREGSYKDATGCYVTMNPSTLPVTNELAGGGATSDGDVKSRTRLVIDIDPIRHGAKSTIPATEGERLAAIQKAGGLIIYLCGEGWPEPGWVETPNGVQLWWKVDLPAEDDGLIEGALGYLQSTQSDETAKIDSTLHNPSRIVRIPGTPGRKGTENTSERPWRCGGVWIGPTMTDSPTLANGLLMDFASRAGDRVDGPYHPPGPADSEAVNNSMFWLLRWLRDYRVPNVGRFNDWKNGGKLAELSACPWQEEHDESYRAFVGVHPSGRFMARCHGERCKDKHWRDFRALYEQARQPTSSLAGYGYHALTQ